jgi:hypothetical protein
MINAIKKLQESLLLLKGQFFKIKLKTVFYENLLKLLGSNFKHYIAKLRNLFVSKK